MILSPEDRRRALAAAERICNGDLHGVDDPGLLAFLANALLKRWHDEPSPWVPMTEPGDVKHLLKLIEELNEAAQAAARCLMQGVDEAEPSTGKPNREWLAEELADVLVNTNLCIERFKLDAEMMTARMNKKAGHLRRWHSMAS